MAGLLAYLVLDNRQKLKVPGVVANSNQDTHLKEYLQPKKDYLPFAQVKYQTQ